MASRGPWAALLESRRAEAELQAKPPPPQSEPTTPPRKAPRLDQGRSPGHKSHHNRHHNKDHTQREGRRYQEGREQRHGQTGERTRRPHVEEKQVAKPALAKTVEVKQPEEKPAKAKYAEATAPSSWSKSDLKEEKDWPYKTEAPKRHVEVEKPESQEKWEAQPVQEKRKLDLRRKFRAGQKHVTPPPADPARAFYSSLLDEKPDSRIAIKYMVEHGVPHAAQSHEELFAKYLAIKKEEEKTNNSKQRSLLRSKGRFRDFRRKQQKQLRGTGLSNSALKTQERAPPSSTNRTCLQAARSGDNDRTSAARSHSSTTDQKAAGSTTDQKAFREVRATTMAAFAFGTATAAPMTPPESQTTARAAIAAGTATSAPRTPPDDIISSV